MPYPAAMFDLDGTLLDTLDDLADSMNRALEAMGFPPHPVDAYRYIVGSGVREMARRSLPEDARDDETIDALAELKQQEYTRNWADKTRPYDGVPEMLDALRAGGIRMAVLSNKPDGFTRLAVEKLLPDWDFDVVRGAADGTPHKPDPTSALEIVEAFGLQPADVFYVGDTDVDMQTAVRAGMFPAGVLWGFRTADELTANGARVLLERPADALPHFDL